MHYISPPTKHTLIFPVRLVLVCCSIGFLLSIASNATSVQANHITAKSPSNELESLPIPFIPNTGQTDGRAQFIAEGRGGALFFTANEMLLALPARDPQPQTLPPFNLHQPSVISPTKAARSATKQPPTVLRTILLEANPSPIVTGTDLLPGLAHFLIGNNPAEWRTDLPTYAGIVYQQIYPGIDLHYDGLQGQLKSTYIIAPGGDTSKLRWRYDGAQRVRIDQQGNLEIKLAPPHGRTTEDRVLVEQAPVAWQDIAGQRVDITANFALSDDGTVGFILGVYDPAYPLIIDPILTFSSYLGGSGRDLGNSIAVGGDGSIYLAGNTASTNFPLNVPFQAVKNSLNDIFITKIQNGVRVYSTYFGGNDDDFNNGIGVDSSNQIYVTGQTISTNLPLPSAYDATPNGGFDVFLTKFSASGSTVLYGTLLGGSGGEGSAGIAIGGSTAAIVGSTDSPNLVPASLPSGARSYDNTVNGTGDGFFAQFDTSLAGSASLKHVSYLGGSSYDQGNGIARTTSGLLYITGYTDSTNFFPATLPTGTKSYDTTPNGMREAFVAGFDPTVTGSGALKFASYFGGSNIDEGNGVAVDSSGKIYITGATLSTNIPTVLPYDVLHNGDYDAFVAHFDPNITGISSLKYSTFLGGSAEDRGTSIATELLSGRATITGHTLSTNFPTLNPSPMRAISMGSFDAFVAEFHPPAGFADPNRRLAYSAYLGGESSDGGTDISVDSSGRAYVVGTTSSTAFPISGNPQQSTKSGLQDAFVSKIFPEEEGECHWPHTLTTQLILFYNWGNFLSTPGTSWRTAFESAIQGWNNAGANVFLSLSPSNSTITMNLYSQQDGRTGKTLLTCPGGIGTNLTHADVLGNSFYNPTGNQLVATHEIGHGIGLGHIGSNSAAMRADLLLYALPQALDIELSRLIYR